MKSASDVQDDEVTVDKDVLFLVWWKKEEKGERKSSNPWLTKPNALLH